ncbi:MAG: hypothetical protein EA414_15190 [Arthrospira sp. PLM2.Bin9]|nr:MAG: hypothetical protein EA414_15190 [Arthrospira sp. PLM2.Bin9]
MRLILGLILGLILREAIAYRWVGKSAGTLILPWVCGSIFMGWREYHDQPDHINKNDPIARSRY